MDNNESKAERFVRLAEPRVFRACKAISLIGHLAASSYEYTDKQVESMFEALQNELNTQKAKLFISQPMKDKTNDEIERARERAIREATEYIGEPVEIIDSFFKDAPHDAKPLWFLAESIRLMADADLVYFAKGWKDARGCMIERECAVQYGVPILEPDY